MEQINDASLKQYLGSKGVTPDFFSQCYATNRGIGAVVQDYFVVPCQKTPDNGRTAFYEIRLIPSGETLICKDYKSWMEFTDTSGKAKAKEEERLERFLHKMLSNHGAFVPQYFGGIQTEETYMLFSELYSYTGLDLLNRVQDAKHKILSSPIKDLDKKIGHMLSLFLDINNINDNILELGLEKLISDEAKVNAGFKYPLPIENVVRALDERYLINDNYFAAELDKSITTISDAINRVYAFGEKAAVFNENKTNLKRICQEHIIKKFNSAKTKISDEPYTLLLFYSGHIVLKEGTFNKLTSLFDGEYKDKTLDEFLRDNPWNYKSALKYRNSVIKAIKESKAIKERIDLPDKSRTPFDGMAIIDYAGVGRSLKILPTAAFLNSFKSILTMENLKQRFEHDLYSMIRLERNQAEIPLLCNDRTLKIYAARKWDELIAPALIYFSLKEAYYKINIVIKDNKLSDGQKNQNLEEIISDMRTKIKEYSGENKYFKHIACILFGIEESTQGKKGVPRQPYSLLDPWHVEESQIDELPESTEKIY